jgi:hypothetical protein
MEVGRVNTSAKLFNEKNQIHPVTKIFSVRLNDFRVYIRYCVHSEINNGLPSIYQGYVTVDDD